MNKGYLIKFYTLSGTYIETVNDKEIKNEIQFTSSINGVQGQCILDLNIDLDTFDDTTTWAMRVAKIYEIDTKFNLKPVLIYTGFISQYAPYFDEGNEGIRITLLGIGSLMQLAYFKNGTSFTVTKTTQDPAQIMKDIIDHFNTIYPNTWITYAGLKIDTVGQVISYEFIDTKWLDALKKTFELISGGWWWKIAEDGNVYLKLRPTSPTHKFTMGYDISNGELPRNNEQIVNKYQLRYGSTPTVANYEDASSILLYGTREKPESDSNITDATTSDQKGNGVIADNKDAKVQAKIKINNNYNIELVKVGDTCSIFNKNKNSTLFPDNMLITAIQYNPEFIIIDLENTKASFASNFIEAVQNI